MTGSFDRGGGTLRVEFGSALINNADLGWDYLNARRYDKAVAQWLSDDRDRFSLYLAHYHSSEALQLKGQLTEAIAEYRAAVELNDDPISARVSWPGVCACRR